MAELILYIIHLILLHSCIGTAPRIILCQSDANCTTNEYCEKSSRDAFLLEGPYIGYANRCKCIKGYIRAPSGACLSKRLQGEPCFAHAQCSQPGLTCILNRCSCPIGLTWTNHSCTSVEPTPPVHLQSIWKKSGNFTIRPKHIRSQGSSGGYAGPIGICVLIFLSFSVLIITTAYSFRARNRRLDEVRAILSSVAATNAAAPNARRASIGSLRDGPPSYSTLSPPSYEQATRQSPTSSSSPSRIVSHLRNPSAPSYEEATGQSPASSSSSPSSSRNISPLRSFSYEEAIKQSPISSAPSSYVISTGTTPQSLSGPSLSQGSAHSAFSSFLPSASSSSNPGTSTESPHVERY